MAIEGKEDEIKEFEGTGLNVFVIDADGRVVYSTNAQDNDGCCNQCSQF